MSHLTDEQILKYLLEQEEAPAHLASCEECERRVARMRNEIEQMGSLEISAPDLEIPLPRAKTRWRTHLLRAAAVLLIGFAAGYGTAVSFQSECLNVVPYRAGVVTHAVGEEGNAVCEAVDLQPRI